MQEKAGNRMTNGKESPGPDLMNETVRLVQTWNFSETQLDNGMTAYTKPIFGTNGNITSLIFLFPFADPSFNAIMMEIVAYLPIVIPEQDRPRVADFVVRMAQKTVSFAQLDMDTGIVSMKHRIFLKDRLFPNDFLGIIGDQLYGEADALIPVLNKMVYAGLLPKDATAEVDILMGYNEG
jgi:hypothetical protein